MLTFVSSCKFSLVNFARTLHFFTNSLENLVCQSTFSEEVASTPLPPSKKEGEPVRTSPPLKVSKSRKQFLVFSIFPKTERKIRKNQLESSQDIFFSFFVRIETTKNYF